MKNFFLRYINFWIVSRILMTLMALFAFFTNPRSISLLEVVINASLFILAFLLIVITLQELILKRTIKAFKIIAGIILIIFGIVLLYLLSTANLVPNPFLVFIAYSTTFWIIATGLFELIVLDVKEAN